MCINTRNGAAWNTVIASGRVLTFGGWENVSRKLGTQKWLEADTS